MTPTLLAGNGALLFRPAPATMVTMASIGVFCGSNLGVDDPRSARRPTISARAIAEGGHRLVYGGGHVGLMGAVADAALAAGGEVVGVITEHLVGAEVAHTRR